MPNLEPIPMTAIAAEHHSPTPADVGDASASASASDDWGYEAALPYLSVDSFQTPPASQERS